jgi:methionine synthase II (cobalamin-independent)
LKLSTDRILTTHVGSLPRPKAMLDLIRAREAGEPVAIPIPDDKVLIPGILDSTSNFVEHPRLIAHEVGG